MSDKSARQHLAKSWADEIQAQRHEAVILEMTAPGAVKSAPDRKMSKYLEWSGCVFGLIGAFLLALNNSISGFGFVAFLVSNIFWILFARSIKASGLMLMQLGFTATSVLGVYKWLV